MGKFNANIKTGIRRVSEEEENVADQIREDLKKRPDATVNYEGALSFKLDPLTDLYIRASGTLVGESKFYTDASQSDLELLRSVRQVAKINPEFILQLALYCREKLHLRSVALMLIAEFANDENCVGKVEFARKYVSRIIQRADELTELVAYQLARNKSVPRQKTKLPMLIRFGLSRAFNNFDSYQFAKYDNKKKGVRMRDSMFLSHPNPMSIGRVQSETFQKLADDELEPPETWEVMISSRKMSWHDVIHRIFHKNGRVNNYMAIMRNLRNCLQDKSVTKDDIELLCRMISDRNAVLHSKQLPFRYLAAYKELLKAAVKQDVLHQDRMYRSMYRSMYMRMDNSDKKRYENNVPFTPIGMLCLTDVLDAIEKAASYSIDNFPKLSGTSTLIACDVSGSMEKPISKNSTIERFDIGILLGMTANRFAGHTITGMFGDTWKVLPMSKTDGILKNTLEMHRREGEVGYSTNGYKVIDYLLKNDIHVDRIMLFTDNQMWDSDRNIREYRSRFSSMFDSDDDPFGEREVSIAERFLLYKRRYPDTKCYIFNMDGYGEVSIPQDIRGVCILGGWSDSIFDFILSFEEMVDTYEPGIESIAVKNIKAIKP